MAADSATMSLTRRSRSSAPFLTESSESAASFESVQHFQYINLENVADFFFFFTLDKASNTSLK